ncbi:bifunctional folylpolyglutamate synthase/dihydrofolate synthase [Actinoplanes sp. TBRC 11911]|uniref:bifunctional folylpolyglutamate synthase/dihydrofolate synthase n=1 Tax=Actinoplanes sp. TBRC 11911 TaxID=2729386 RepID=UPI00145CBA51|nr:folylpolyglutamate synthase/dihydrofolate synthase family protein [Actinoplanes sp. TBRC 11911]NMO57247.1 bifunctional folylpolyglutamate synthase/dihydrofolate synthase [Actinoplanes sp. TBRC 11911]
MSEFDEVNAALESRGFTRMVFDMRKIRELMDVLGSPQRAYPSIHLTGTNGKTSTARMIDSLLRAHGLHTGRYTSPHLETIRERITLDGEPISEEKLVEAYREIEPLTQLIDAKYDESLTYFDVTTALAYAVFADAPVDVAVVEVGLGGEEDSTNTIDAGIAVMTPIGLDHTEFLGDTIEDIAWAKAGIIHQGATVITALQEEEAMRPILERSIEMGAKVAREGSEFGVVERSQAVGGQVLTLQGLGGIYGDVFLPLFGAHQAQNAAMALAAVEAFLGAGQDKQLEIDLVREGFAQVDSPGRLERVRSAPTILLDGAHNTHGMAATVQALEEEFQFRHLVAVVAILDGKDAEGMLDLLEPVAARIVVTRNSSPRTMPLEELTQLATDIFGEDRVTVAENMPDAIEEAVVIAEDDASGELSGIGVVITGSVITVADARRLLKRSAPWEGASA